MITRRRFLSIAGAVGLGYGHPIHAAETAWHGYALGAEASIKLRGPQKLARSTMADIGATLRRTEALFSLYSPTSAVSRLNQTGILANPDPEFVALLQLCHALYHATEGAFDPTVQSLWHAHATGGDIEAAQTFVGWDRVRVTSEKITLAPGQALTLNGIAQGWATDQIAAVLRRAGYEEALVDIGEIAAIGGPWRVGIASGGGAMLERVTLRDRAIATSSPDAMTIGGVPHILNPADTSQSKWSTVTVEAESAAIADGLSTACCYLDRRSAGLAAKALTERGIVRQYS